LPWTCSENHGLKAGIKPPNHYTRHAGDTHDTEYLLQCRFSCSSLYTGTPEQAQENLLIETSPQQAAGYQKEGHWSETPRFLRDCSRDPGFDMDRAGDHFYTTGPNHFFPREPTMFGPGAYVPDSTEGIVDVKDLPVPQLGLYSRNHKHTPCPRCGHLASRHTSDQRTLHDLGD